MKTIHIEAMPLQVPLKATFRHAAAARDRGESLWVRARRNAIAGYGEGCPRVYVAGDDLESSLLWVRDIFTSQKVRLESLAELQGWVQDQSALIDRYPSAWCAVETALLDLFAREEGCSVETLLGLLNAPRRGRYTAVLGDDPIWKYATLVDQYLIRGLADFKIKLNGRFERDVEKLKILEEFRTRHHVQDLRVRLDANNLWKDRCDEAIAYLMELAGPVFAVEEPVGARNAQEMGRVSVATGLPVILDESLCTLEDLRRFGDLPGKFIANIKISRVGGLIRTMGLIAELKKLGWPIIIGCHAGETSLLTRVALVAASAAGDSLTAQEGAFGDYLMEREPVKPTLKFGRQGLLNLDAPCCPQTARGLKWDIPPTDWDIGFGLEGRFPVVMDDGSPKVRFFEMPDQEKIHYRLWGKTEGEDAVMILHDGMGHSGWQAPLAKELRAISPAITVVAPDQRGCGINGKRGDLGSVPSAIDDVLRQVEFLKKSFRRVHLAGLGQGAQYACIAASRLGPALSSLILLAPGFFWNERFGSVLCVAEKTVLRMFMAFKLKPQWDEACVPLPMEGADFTRVDEWLDFIHADELKTTMMTLRSLTIMSEIQGLSCSAVLQNTLPILTILATNDRMVDNGRVRDFLAPLFSGNPENRLLSLECGHALQLEKPREVAAEIVDFIHMEPCMP